MLSACHIQNTVPYKKTRKTPYELWRGYKPNLSYLKVWGCLVKVLKPVPKRTRLGPKTIDCLFIGYAQNSATYRFLVLRDKGYSFEAGTIIESKNTEFFEYIFPKKTNITYLPQNESIGDPLESSLNQGNVKG